MARVGSVMIMTETNVYNDNATPTTLEKWAARVNQIATRLRWLLLGFCVCLLLVSRFDSHCLNSSSMYGLTIVAPIVMLCIHSVLVIVAFLLWWRARRTA